MEADPYHSAQYIFLQILTKPLTLEVWTGCIALIVLLIISALVSGSEVSFFSLSPTDIKRYSEKKSRNARIILKLVEQPENLLATILVANNFVNVGIVILSTFLSNSVFDFTSSPYLGFIFQVVIITFVIVLFGEIMPKVYATQFSSPFSRFMAGPLYFLGKLLRPINYVLIRSTSVINRRLSAKQSSISIDDLSQALNLTSDELMDEKILKGIVNFGNIDVKEIMKPRMNVVCVDINTRFKKLVAVIIESGFSRIPVYSENFDNIQGILYIKDLLPYMQEEDDFSWNHLLRKPYFVPENKKINDLLKEFQWKKIHLAIIIDEYGGGLGIVTFEDILEEIVGEINDESDEIEVGHLKLEDGSYVFEGKTLLNDFYKIIGCDPTAFDKVKGEADSIAGLILEMKGNIPHKNEEISYRQFLFIVKSVDVRRIKQVRVVIKSLKN